VGSGKTMLMDMFLKTLPAANISHPMANFPATRGPATSSSSSAAAGTHGLCQLAAQRLHFHSFMLNVHQQLHQLQQSLPKAVGRSRAGLLVYR
jgi:predicted ATPase